MARIQRRNGAYAPLGEKYASDDAVLEVSAMAELLYVRGLAFAAGRIQAEGYITEAQLAVIGVKITGSLKKHAQQLVEHRLWDKVDGGYQIRAWLKWNPSASEVDKVRAGDRERKRRFDSGEIPFSDEQDSDRNPSGVTLDSLTVSSSVQGSSVIPPNPPAPPGGSISAKPTNPRALGTNPRGPKTDPIETWANATTIDREAS